MGLGTMWDLVIRLLSNPDFQLNVMSGLLIFVLELMVVILGLPVFLSWLDRRKWRHMRQFVLDHLSKIHTDYQRYEGLAYKIYDHCVIEDKLEDQETVDGWIRQIRDSSPRLLSRLATLVDIATPAINASLSRPYAIFIKDLSECLWTIQLSGEAPLFYELEMDLNNKSVEMKNALSAFRKAI